MEWYLASTRPHGTQVPRGLAGEGAPACLRGCLFDDYSGQGLELRKALTEGEDDRPRRSKFDRNVCVAASATQTATSQRRRRSEVILLEVPRYAPGTPQGHDI